MRFSLTENPKAEPAAGLIDNTGVSETIHTGTLDSGLPWAADAVTASHEGRAKNFSSGGFGISV